MMEDEICAGEEVFVAGQFFRTTGIHTVELQDGDGCSYDIVLDLVVNACNQSSIGNRVWEDINADGIQDAGEIGMEGVIVSLYTTNGELVSTMSTDSNGNYFFGDIEVGDYYLQFTLPDTHGEYIPTVSKIGDDNAVDSDLVEWSISEVSNTDNKIWSSEIISVFDNTAVMSMDAGFYRSNSIGDQVWFDNGDGGLLAGFDDSDTPAENIIVRLFNAQDSLINATETDEHGNYLFTSLPAGEYYVEFTAPEEYAFVDPNAIGDEENDSDAYVDLFDDDRGVSQIVFVLVGENNFDIDAGLRPMRILGLQLLDFTVKYEEEDNLAFLLWSTNNEVNTDVFDIERSHEAAEEFTKIGQVNAAGNSSVQMDYDFTDEGLESGTYYYRLKMIDLDGTYTYSPVRSVQVKEKFIKSEISSIFPNPTTGRVNIEIQKSSKDDIVTGGIYDVLGEELIVISHEDNVRNSKLVVDLSNLAEGDYIVRIQIGVEVFVKKVILTKAD